MSSARYRAEHRERIKTARRAYTTANADKVRARNAKWRAENREHVRLYNAAYYASDQDGQIARASTYRAENTARVRAAVANYRARQLNPASVDLTADDVYKALTNTLGICAYCNEQRALTLDHIEPLQSGGANDTSNVAAACKPCNQSKRTLPLLVWLAQKAATKTRHQQRSI